MTSILKISDLQLIGAGDSKRVYQHPEDAGKVIKVMRKDKIAPDGGFIDHGYLKRRLFQGAYRQFRREIIQYLQLCKENYIRPHQVFPVETPYGWVMTDEGLGLVVEKIVASNGQGLTLNKICKNGEFQKKHALALKEFFNKCVDLHVVFGEVNDAGIMYTEIRNAKPEFVLVDGMGEKLFIPVRALFKSQNAKYIRKVENRICNRLSIEY